MTAVGTSLVVAVAGCGAEKDVVLGSGSAIGVELRNHRRLHPPLGDARCQAFQTLTWSWVVQNDKAASEVVVLVCLSTLVETLKSLGRELRTSTCFPRLLLETVRGEWVQVNAVLDVQFQCLLMEKDLSLEGEMTPHHLQHCYFL